MGFYHTLVSATFDGLRVGTLTQQQPNGSKYDALAGTRLTGNDREPAVQFNVQLVN